MQFTKHYATLRGIHCASVSNIDSAVAGTRDIPGVEPFILHQTHSTNKATLFFITYHVIIFSNKF